MNRLDVFTNILIRWIGLGAWFGALAGGACGIVFVFGVPVFGILGLPIGLGVGLMSGIILGTILGAYTGILTCTLFFPPVNDKRYKNTVVVTCTIFGFATSIVGYSSLIYPHEYRGLSFVPSSIAALVIAYIASRIASWYVRKFSTQISAKKAMSQRHDES